MKTFAYSLDNQPVQHNLSIFNKIYTPMKASAYQHLSAPRSIDRMYNSYQSHIGSLNAAQSAIMDRLTVISPFILMLIPVMAMIVYSLF